MFDGRMEHEKSDATTGPVADKVTRRYCEGAVIVYPGSREVGQYSYRLVYTQESIRLLDLRLYFPSVDEREGLGVLLAAANDCVMRDCLTNICLIETEGLND